MEWQEAIRDRYNIKGEQVVVAKPSNPAHLSILKEMCLKAGFTSDQANSILLILEKDDDKYKSIGYGRYKLKTDIGPDGKAKEGTPTFTKDDAGNYVKSGEDDEKKDDEEKKEKPETNPNFAKDGEEPEPGQSTVDGDHLTSKKPEKEEEPKPDGTPVKPLSSTQEKTIDDAVNVAKEEIQKLDNEIDQIEDESLKERKEGERERLKEFVSSFEKFKNAKTQEERVEAVRTMVEFDMLSRNAPSRSANAKRKVYLTENVTGLDYKELMPGGSGTAVTNMISDIIDDEGLHVDMRNSSADRQLAKVSGDHNETGVVAMLDPSEENQNIYEEWREDYSNLAGSDNKAHEQNKEAAKTVKEYLSNMKPPCDVDKAEAMGHLGNDEIKQKYKIDPKKNPTDLFVFCKDGRRIGISAKIYSNPRSITMKNSGTKSAGSHYLDDPSIDEQLDALKEKHNIGNNPSAEDKVAFKHEYLKLWHKSMIELSKSTAGQQKLLDMWKEIHGCGEGVATLITNKSTGESVLRDEDYYCNPPVPLEVDFNGKKISVNLGSEGGVVEMVFKTEKDGSVKLLFQHISKSK